MQTTRTAGDDFDVLAPLHFADQQTLFY